MGGLRARYDGLRVTASAAAALVAGTFVKATGSTTQGGEYSITTCGSGDRPFGVAEADVTTAQLTQDTNSVERRVDVIRKPAIARVVPGATISGPGLQLQSDSLGRAIPLGAATAATLNTGVVGSNNAITFTARAAGAGGNAVTVTFVDPGGTTAALSVDVAENGHDITVSLARASSALSSTAQNIMDAIEANGDANTLVSVVDQSTSNGTGIAAAVTKTALAGGTDPEGGGHVVGYSMTAAASSDPFVEVELT